MTKCPQNPVNRRDVIFNLGNALMETIGFREQIGPLGQQSRYSMLERCGSGAVHAQIVANPRVTRHNKLGELAT